MQRVLAELGVEDEVLLWNVVSTHPGSESSNRPPTREAPSVARGAAEFEAGLRRSFATIGRRRAPVRRFL